MFKIVSPLSSLSELKELVDAGVDELYFGLMTTSWKKKHSNIISMNKREFESSNLNSNDEIKKISEYCKEKGVATSLTLNSHFYTDSQVKKICKLLHSIDVDNLIISDIGLINLVKERFPKFNIIISTGSSVFNTEAVKFYENLGSKRIILPRHVRLNEITKIVKTFPLLEFEIFTLNVGCINIDGFCKYAHGFKEDTKKNSIFSNDINKKLFRIIPKKIQDKFRTKIDLFEGCACREYYLMKDNKKGKITNQRYNSNREGYTKCGVCVLSKLKNLKNLHLKIVGRENNLRKKLIDIKFLKKVISKTDMESEKFQDYCKSIYQTNYKRKCSDKECYYEF